jgi:hypothetical protein
MTRLFPINPRLPLQIAVAGGAGLLLGVASLWASPLYMLVALAGGALLLATLKRPEIAVIGYLVLTSSLIAEKQNPGFGIAIGTMYATDVILLGAFVLIVVRLLAEPGFSIVRTPLNVPMISFMAVAAVSTVGGIVRSWVAFEDSLGEARSVASYLLFFVVVNLVRDERQLRWLGKGLCLLACAVAAMMAIQYAIGSSLTVVPGRVESLRTEGQVYAGVTRLIPPGASLVTVMFTVTTVMVSMQRVKAMGAAKLFQWLLLGLGLLLTFFRSYWVTTGLSLLILALISSGHTRRRLAMCCLVAALLVAPLFLFARMEAKSPPMELLQASADRLLSLGREETYADSDSSLRYRDIENKYALFQIASQPILGLGLGAAYRPFLIGRDWEGVRGTAFIHNGHLWLIVKTGLLGYLAFAWLSAVFLFRGFKYWRRVPKLWMRATVLGFTLAYLATLIISVVEPTLLYQSWTPVIGVMLGFNEAVFRQVMREPA